MANYADVGGSTSSSSTGSCSSTSGIATAGLNSSREAHVRLLLQPEVDQRRRQSARSLRLGADTQCFFDERFKFPVSHDHLAEKTLRFQVNDPAPITFLVSCYSSVRSATDCSRVNRFPRKSAPSSYSGDDGVREASSLPIEICMDQPLGMELFHPCSDWSWR